MTDLLEHLATNIKQIVSKEDESSSVEKVDNFESTMNDVKTFLTQMGLNESIINNFEVKITKIFDDLIKDGISFREAFEKAFDSSTLILEQSIHSESNIDDNNQKDYDMSFANTSSSPNTLLIDQAIAKGMTVEEAINYVNTKKIESDSYGPEFAGESKDLNESIKNISMSKDEKDLNKIEADMDAQASNLASEKIDQDKNLINEYESDTSKINEEDELG